MTDIEILEGLKSYTSKPEVIDKTLKLREAIEKIKDEIEDHIYDISTEDTYEDGISVGLVCALDFINKYTEGLI